MAECPTIPDEAWGKTVNLSCHELSLWSNVIQWSYISLVVYQCLKCFLIWSNCYSVTCRKFLLGNWLNYINDVNTFRNYLAKQVWCDAKRHKHPLLLMEAKLCLVWALGRCVNIFSQCSFTKQAASMWLFSIPRSTSLENTAALGISEQFGAMQVGWHWLWYRSQKYQLAGSAWRESDCSEGTYGYCVPVPLQV